jgi:hypothetical protein
MAVVVKITHEGYPIALGSKPTMNLGDRTSRRLRVHRDPDNL